MQVEAAHRLLEHERDLALIALVARLGLETPPAQVRLGPGDPVAQAACDGVDGMIEEALASRPDVRGAEIAIEAAGQRASWERSRVVNLIAVLDANGRGDEGFELGPGLTGELPIFFRNQGAIARGEAELARAGRTYLAVRTQVVAEVRAAAIRLEQSRQALDAWEREIVPALEAEQLQAEAAYQSGEAALLSLLDVSRRLVDARGRRQEAEVSLQKAAVELDRSVGRRCAGF
jgi:cobalt-zinc-cadmium efflux system outer membrane protein